MGHQEGGEVSHWPTYLIPPWGLCRRDGLLELHKLCLGSQVGAGFRRTLLSHPGVISTPLPHTPAGSMQPHKASLCQAGGREPQRAAGGGEEEVAHAAREHLEPI